MKVSFELSPRDIRYFRDRLKAVRAGDGNQDEKVVIRGARNLVQEAIDSEPPDFVLVRIRTLEKLIAMLDDDAWRLEGADRTRILDALAYFVDPNDMIHDHIPGIGFLDDAIMVELVAGELKHEIEAYDDFCLFRKQYPKTADEERLEKRRVALQSRMRRRRRRDRTNRGSTGRSKSSRIRLW